jgi:hypothetical protein
MGTDRLLEKLANQVLQDLSAIKLSSSQTAERLATGVMNGVLVSERVVFDSTGIKGYSWGTTCGSIEVANHGTEPVYVASSTPQSGSSPAMPQVDGGTVRLINVGSRNVTLYGTAASAVSVQAFTRGGLSSYGIMAINGGAP